MIPPRRSNRFFTNSAPADGYDNLDRLTSASQPLLGTVQGQAGSYRFEACGSAALALRRDQANPRNESVEITHFDGSKLYQRGPLR
jgi:hypothetical protein